MGHPVSLDAPPHVPSNHPALRIEQCVSRQKLTNRHLRLSSTFFMEILDLPPPTDGRGVAI
jgi:hypothetical protein